MNRGGEEFIDEQRRRYRIARTGELFKNYKMQGLLGAEASDVEDALLREHVPSSRDMGPLLLQFSLPRGKQTVPPNPAFDGGSLELVHVRTTKRVHVSYSIVTKRGARDRSGFIYTDSFVLLDHNY